MTLNSDRSIDTRLLLEAMLSGQVGDVSKAKEVLSKNAVEKTVDGQYVKYLDKPDSNLIGAIKKDYNLDIDKTTVERISRSPLFFDFC